MKNVWPWMACFAGGCLLMGACRSTYYAAYEKVGLYKRDLLKKRVVAARDEQAEAGQEFKDALTRLKEMTGFNGGALEKNYRRLQGDYDDCAARTSSVHKRIRDVEIVAGDLFAEWERELPQIQTPSLRQASREQLDATRRRYDQMHAALQRSAQTMDPVLVKFHDYVLFLKHNLNAQAIASLQGEATAIQADITRLIADMNHSIAQADAFVQGLD
jgi:hypothetical protein